MTKRTADPPDERQLMWSIAATVLVLVLLLVAAGLWFRSAGPLVVKGERVAVAAPAVAQTGRGEPQLLELDRVLAPGDYAWNEEGADGAPWFVVDLARSEFHAFRGDLEIGRTAVLHGKVEKPTPIGTFRISEKDVDHVSNIYNGAPMPFMLRLTNDGVAIHASTVEYGENTHGCVGVPYEFAQKLFATAGLGTPVVIVDEGAVDRDGRLTVRQPTV